MNKNDCSKMKDLGIRFLLFRKAIRKTQVELAKELSVNMLTIKAIESGDISPNISYLHYLSLEYALDINWLLCGQGKMFANLPPETVDVNYIPTPGGETDGGKYAELLQLMQIPAIEKIILDWLEEFKKQLQKKG